MRLITLITFYAFLSFHLSAQNLVFKEIGRPDSSNSHWAKFDVKYFGKDSLIICQSNARQSLHKLDESLNILKYSDHLYVPDTLKDSLIGISTFPSCFVDNDGIIRLYGDFTTSTNGMHYNTHRFNYTYNHQLDSIDSKLKRYYHLINDSIEFVSVRDSIRYIEIFNRNSKKKYTVPFDSIVPPKYQSQGGLFYLRVSSSNNRIMMILTSNKLVVSALDFQGNLKSQYVAYDKYYHSGFDLDTGLFLLSDHFEVKMFNENLELQHTAAVDSNEIIFGVIPNNSKSNSFYIFSQEYFGKYVKYYEWDISNNTLTQKGVIYNSNIVFNLHRVIPYSDSSFFLVGNFKLTNSSKMRNYAAIIKGNPVGDSILIDGNNYQLSNYSTLSQREEVSNRFKIFPNPASSYIRLQYSKNSIFKYVLSDLSGKPILRGEIRSDGQIEVNSFSNGIYILTLYSSSDYKSFRIIKE
jgi:hypothetical protein